LIFNYFSWHRLCISKFTENGDLIEAAANLFSALHRLDDSGVSVIYAQAVTETGLGLAIMDRLRKASAPAEN